MLKSRFCYLSSMVWLLLRGTSTRPFTGTLILWWLKVQVVDIWAKFHFKILTSDVIKGNSSYMILFLLYHWEVVEFEPKTCLFRSFSGGFFYVLLGLLSCAPTFSQFKFVMEVHYRAMFCQDSVCSCKVINFQKFS